MLRGIEHPGHGGEFNPVFTAEVQPSHEILHAVITGEAGKFDGEDHVYLAGADVPFEPGACLEVVCFSPGGGGVAIIVDLILPALGVGIGGELFTLDSESVGGLRLIFAGLADVDGSACHGFLIWPFFLLASFRIFMIGILGIW